MKRIISLLLVLCLLGSMIPFQAFAAEDDGPSVEDLSTVAPESVPEEDEEESEQVTVVDSPESDILAIEVPTVTKVEGAYGWVCEGYWSEDDEWIDFEWFKYNVRPEYFTVYYADGSEETYCDWDEEYWELILYSDQNGTNPWGVGTHTVTAEFYGVTCEYEFVIIENPVDYIEVEPITTVEFERGWWWDGYNDDDGDWVEIPWFEYDIEPDEVTVYYKDGSVETYSSSDVYNETGYNLGYTSHQSGEDPWGIGTHEATVSFLGLTCEYQFIIIENPVERIEIEPVILMEFADGYWKDGYYDEDDDWVDEKWYYYRVEPEMFTVYYKDGRVETYLTDECYDLTGYSLTTSSTQSYENQWGAGTYTAEATFMDATCEYEIVIEETPVAWIEVPSITISEYSDGWWMEHETDDGESVKWFLYDVNPDEITLHYKDGTVETYGRWDLYDETGYDISLYDDQSWYDPWGAGVYTVTAYYMGVTCEFEVVVESFPEIDCIEVPTVYRLEGANQETMWEMNWDEDLEDWVETSWTRYNIEPETFTVYYADGRVSVYGFYEVIDSLGVELFCESDQSADNKWGCGTHTATASFMGVTCEYQVIIEESPVERIEVAPVTLIDGVDGYWTWDEIWDDEEEDYGCLEWYYYEVWPSEITVYYKDGTVSTYDTDCLQDETGATLYCTSDQGPENNWGLGTYIVRAEYMGVSCEYEVRIIESPVERIEVAPMSIIQGTNGWRVDDCIYDHVTEYWYDVVWYEYDVEPAEFTVYYKDGTVTTYSCWDAYDTTGYFLEYTSCQSYENQWDLGTYTVTAEFMGAVCEYEVTITETPVERIEVAPITLLEEYDGYWDDCYWDDELEEWVSEPWFCYYPVQFDFTVYYKDGTVENYNYYSIFEETGYDLELITGQDGANAWGPGTYTVQGRFMGGTCDIVITVVENPVERIEIAPMTLIHNVDGSMSGCYDDEGEWIYDAWYAYFTMPSEFTVYYKDGTSAVYLDNEAYELTGYELSFWDDQYVTNQWGLGTYYAYASYMGRECTYEINIVETPVARVEIADMTIAEGVLNFYHSESVMDPETGDVNTNRWWGYYYLPEDVTVYYKDGTVATYSYADLYRETRYSMDLEGVEYYENRWGLGTHTINFEFMGVSGSYDVTIVENPVERIEVADVYLTEGVDGDWMEEYWDPSLGEFVEGKWFNYDVYPSEVTVYYKDGSVITYPYERIYPMTGYNCDITDEQSYFNQWGVGTYTATAEHMGCCYDYQVIILPAEGQEALAITRQPVDYIGAMNSMATFTVEVNKDDVTYQWYYSTDGKSWDKSGASGSTTDTMSVQVVAFRLGQMYRCVITDSQGNAVTSNAVSLNLPESTIEIISQPVDFVGGVADTATFTVEATGMGLTYRWYYSDNGGVGWAESWTTGYNTPTANPVLREYNSGRLFKCLITDKNGNTQWTEIVSMSLATGDIVITSQPSDYLGRLNDLAEFTVEAEGVNLSYRWYYSTDGGETWLESWATGYNSAELTVRLHAYRDGYMYKCIIRSGVDNEIECAPATLNKLPTTVQITAQPMNAGGPIGSSVTFTMGATGEGITYQWQFSTDGGEKWADSGMPGAKTNSLTVMVIAARDGQMYRCVVTDDSGTSATTNAVVLRVGNAPVIVSQPQSYTGAVGTTAVFAVEATGDDLIYQWQYSSNGGETWNDSSATGAKTASISVAALAYRNGQMYRCIITNEYGIVISDAATLTVQ